MAANYAPPSTGVKPPPKSIERIQADNEARENERAQLPEWHCSTCGCPDSIAVGRRKGPKGDKSQCGPCGKFYHRYRRTKDVVYNPDPEYHMRIRQTEIERKKRRRGPAKSRKSALGDLGNDVAADTNSPAPGGDDDDDDDDEDDGPPLSQARATTPPPRAKSPPASRQRVRSPSSSPSPPLATARPVESRPPARDPTPPPVPPPAAAPSAAVPSPVTAHHHHVPSFNPDTPGWMLNCLQELQSRYVNDRFIAIIRPPQPTAPPGAPKEWRIKCLDCPGKVYTPGPEETLSNFEVHLRNKKHRDNVNQRLGTAPTHGAPGPAVP